MCMAVWVGTMEEASMAVSMLLVGMVVLMVQHTMDLDTVTHTVMETHMGSEMGR